jgi:hypothetical protein
MQIGWSYTGIRVVKMLVMSRRHQKGANRMIRADYRVAVHAIVIRHAWRNSHEPSAFDLKRKYKVGRRGVGF